MRKIEFQYLSANGSAQVHAILWTPEIAPRAVIQIAHGITEHIGRYEDFARHFTQLGYAVAGNDHLGHGKTMDPKHPDRMCFGPDGSWRFVVEDIRTCGKMLKERFPNAPLCLMGFSLGSFAARCLMGEDAQLADLAIWAGTGQTVGVENAIARMLTRLEQRRFGEKNSTPLLRKLTMDAYNAHFKPCRTGSDWLCANPKAVDDYIADPLCGEGFTVGAFRELLRGMRICGADKHVARMNKNTPILLISGKQDPVGGFGKIVEKVGDQLKKHDFSDVEMQLYDGMRHDIFREKDAAAVFQKIDDWLGKRI